MLGIKIGSGYTFVDEQRHGPHHHGFACYNPALALLNIYLTKLKTYVHKKPMHECFISFIHNISKLETTLMALNEKRIE